MNQNDNQVGKIKQEELAGNKRELAGFSFWLVEIIALAMSIFQIFVLFFYPLEAFKLRSIHLCFALILGFLILKIRKGSGGNKVHFLDLLLCITAIISTAYIFTDYDNLIQRTGVDPTLEDVIFGTCFVFLVLEMTRRTTGMTLVILALIFMGYALGGQYLPENIAIKEYSFARLISFLFSTEGLFTIPLGVSATYVFLFILFGAFLSNSGAGGTFTDLAKAVTGWARGGPAKIAIISSSLFGTISGSAVANVMVTGQFTIPMMKNIGYRANMAGAVEAVASTGGQIMPPIMGAGAFIMAEILGIPYLKVVVAAIIPALLYYWSLYWMIDFEAIKYNLKGLAKAELPRVKNIISNQAHLLMPIVFLIFLLVLMEYSPIRAAILAILSIIICSFLRKDTAMGLRKIIKSLGDGPKGILEVASTCACAGIIVGVMALTGIGMKISNAIISLAHGYLLLALLLTMVICFLLGMGLPTTAAYVIAASTCAPALTQLGVPPLAAHLFIFYYACLSCITPPVALAAFAAAGIAKTNMWSVGWTAVKIGATAYIVPFMFVYGPSLLLAGNAWEVISSILTAAIGTFCLAAGIQGWFFKSILGLQRLLLVIAGITLITPGYATDIIGGLLIALVIFSIRLGFYKKGEVNPINK